MKTIRLLISCPDARGIIAAVTSFVAEHGGNVLDADQHSDKQHGEFFMRVEIDPAGFTLNPSNFESAWRPLADHYRMQWRVAWGDRPKRMAIFVSKAGHCLNDLLWRWKTGELAVDIPCVISNHDALRRDVESLGLTFHQLTITPANKRQQESETQQRLADAEIDFVVLARYMQILSPDFVAAMPNRIINIHHSFLPAFAGAKPYHQAYDRGVKIIGATSHYVTDQLDEGPIIAQETMQVNHRDTVDDLVRKGRDLERIVLARAVRHHVEDKILVSNNKTVVFD
ncbi:MAG: formyltetrahydrofolate deformylase [Phycisphaerales bacterium]|nr:formyltetrahydrofolate deformylase [Phycisphaerales bacterium]MCB9857682.1 formyltetrahydrofolate deformylase [Phycisphaerales bacterium]MCB9864771.1 formyltetrahydrofolate deformylase [Phycisphaerales bacterium]